MNESGTHTTATALVPFIAATTSTSDFETNTTPNSHGREPSPRGITTGWISAFRPPPGIVSSLQARRPSAPPHLMIHQQRYVQNNNQTTEEKNTDRKDFKNNSNSFRKTNELKDESDYNDKQNLTIKDRYLNQKNGYDALTMTLSALYAKLLVVLGMAFPISEILVKQVPSAFYQAFYLYMYVGSICFISIMYCILLKDKTVAKIARSVSVKEKCNDLGFNNPEKQIIRYGSFYLRLGAIAFGVGSMVYSGLEVGEYFELKKERECSNALQVIIPAARMLLTILQMQFLFINSKYMKIHQVKVWTCFGIMHLIATNLCEWLYVLVEETKHEIAHIETYLPNIYSTSDKIHSTHSVNILSIEDYSAEHESGGNRSLENAMECRKSNIVGSLVQSSSAFLFPCTIEYSLICAVILFEIWKNIQFQNPQNHLPRLKEENLLLENNKKDRKCSFYNIGGAVGVHSHFRKSHHFSVDCTSAQRGLFAGILVLVFTIISLILFFVLNKDHELRHIAVYQLNIFELIIYLMTTSATLSCFIQMKELHYSRDAGAGLGLDNTLLIMAQTGMYIYCMFSIIGFHFTQDYNSKIGFTTEVFSLLQTTLQTIFILDSWFRRCTTPGQFRRKPGRQLVTFLLIANMALWTINSLEKSHAEYRPTHLYFFGIWPWTIITHISMPLAIFYRFHSTICLFEIWKTVYKLKPSLQNNNNINNV